MDRINVKMALQGATLATLMFILGGCIIAAEPYPYDYSHSAPYDAPAPYYSSRPYYGPGPYSYSYRAYPYYYPYYRYRHYR